MLNNINKIVKCMSNGGKNDITIGNYYEVYNESEKFYLIADDKYDKYQYPKTLFKELPYNFFTAINNGEEENRVLEEVAAS